MPGQRGKRLQPLQQSISTPSGTHSTATRLLQALEKFASRQRLQMQFKTRYGSAQAKRRPSRTFHTRRKTRLTSQRLTKLFRPKCSESKHTPPPGIRRRTLLCDLSLCEAQIQGYAVWHPQDFPGNIKQTDVATQATVLAIISALVVGATILLAEVIKKLQLVSVQQWWLNASSAC